MDLQNVGQITIHIQGIAAIIRHGLLRDLSDGRLVRDVYDDSKPIGIPKAILIVLVLLDVVCAPTRLVPGRVQYRVAIETETVVVTRERDAALPSEDGSRLGAFDPSAGTSATVITKGTITNGLNIDNVPVVDVGQTELWVVKAVFGITVDATDLSELDGEVSDMRIGEELSALRSEKNQHLPILSVGIIGHGFMEITIQVADVPVR